MNLKILLESLAIQAFCLLIPIFLYIIYTKYSQKNKKNIILQLEQEISFSNFLNKMGLSENIFPLILLMKDKFGIEYISDIYFDSKECFQKDMFLDNNIFVGELFGVIDNQFHTYTIQYKSGKDFGLFSEKLQELHFPTFLKITKNMSFDEIEKIMCNPESEYSYLYGDDLEEYKKKFLPKNMETIVKIIDGKI